MEVAVEDILCFILIFDIFNTFLFLTAEYSVLLSQYYISKTLTNVAIDTK